MIVVVVVVVRELKFSQLNMHTRTQIRTYTHKLNMNVLFVVPLVAWHYFVASSTRDMSPYMSIVYI